jgi:FKBP-type peptidyl-prolyl cis-trans isomerase 2
MAETTMLPFITLHYRLSIIDPRDEKQTKEVFNTFSSTPATIQIGSGYFPDCLDRVLLKHLNEEDFSTRIPASEAYGLRNESLRQTLSYHLMQPINSEKADEDYQIGDVVQVVFPNQHRIAGTFLGEKNQEGTQRLAIIDFNHPMAGFDVLFQGKILGVL